jgi:hypothetical protein
LDVLGDDGYGNVHHEAHDDLVLATALGIWYWEVQGRLRAGVWGVIPIRW